MDKLRILLISNRCPPDFDGGYELRAFQIAQALRERGHELEMATSHYLPTYQGERSDPDWVHRIFHYVQKSDSKFIWSKIDKAIRHIQCTRIAPVNRDAMEKFLSTRPTYDLVYCFGLRRISLALTEPIVRQGLPILWHAGDSFLADYLIEWPQKIPGYRLAFRLFVEKWFQLEKRLDYRNVAFVSEFLRDFCRDQGFLPQKTFVISRGVDFQLGYDVDRERTVPPVFFMACRLHPQKGLHHAVAAAGILQKKRPELAWKIEIAGYGYGSYIDNIKKQIERDGLGDRVKILGLLPRKEVIERMRLATAFLSCSTYGEPFAGTIIETLGIGTPLIGSRAGSILEVVTPEKSALVYDQENVEQLAGHMERILDSRDLQHSLAREGLAVIESRFTLDRIIEQTEAAFTEILADPALSGPMELKPCE